MNRLPLGLWIYVSLAIAALVFIGCYIVHNVSQSILKGGIPPW